MPKVKIVTDSAQDFAPSFMEERGISIVPLSVHFGDVTFKDGYELRGKEFYDKLVASDTLPRTSQPSPGAFEDVFRRLTDDGSAVVTITLSAGLSGTYQSAILAKQALPDRDITVIDSRQGSCGYGLLALQAADMAEGGERAETIAAAVSKMMDSMVTLFTVGTLDYLQKNGRIGRAQHFLGTLLNMKPLLSLDDEGYVTAVERVRGKNKVVPRMVELAIERAGGTEAQALAISHANCPHEAGLLKDAVTSAFNVDKVYESEIGAVIGSHTGPGTIALFLAPR